LDYRLAVLFAEKNVKILLVYPGPPADLEEHAKGFLAKQSDLPMNIVPVNDPDYKMSMRIVCASST
jgi:peroxiredoxin Q/BCP